MAETPTRSLRASIHPQARMQQLLKESNHPNLDTETHTEENTEKITPSHTEIITELITETNTDLLPESIQEGHPSVRPSRRKTMRPDTKASAPPAINTSVRQRIIEDLQKEPVVRKTIDIPASLNERLQDYCAAKRIKTERRVFLVLLENFLDEEGF